MSEEDYNTLYKTYSEKHYNFHNSLQTNASNQGRTRGDRGHFLEKFVEELWQDIGKIKNQKHQSDKQKHVIKSKKGTVITSIGLDRNLKAEGDTKAMVECKSYLDACYLKRANQDAFMLRRQNYLQPMVVVALEQSCSDDSSVFWMEEGNLEHVFILVDGKRDSTKPLYKNFKPLNYDKFKNLCTWMYSL